jgi:hypothetical protein
MAKASRFTSGIIVRDGRVKPSGDTSETKLTQLRVISASLTPASVATITVAAQTLALSGVAVGDFVVCIANPIANAVGIVGVTANGANSISVSFVNPTGGALTPTAGTYTFLVGRFSNAA